MFYDNMDEFAVDGAVPSFVNYVEGIYVGYKFYETAAAEGLIDYDTTVQYTLRLRPELHHLRVQ